MTATMEGSVRPNLDAFFKARSIAFVGASPRSGAVRGMTNRLRQEGFSGRLWMVNPRYQEVPGLPCFPTLRGLPEVPDLVVVAVRASEVGVVITEAASVGAKAAVVISTGFADAGLQGRNHAERLRQVSSHAGILVCGPGSFGFANPERKISPFWDGPPGIMPSGNVAVVAQSGGFANVLAFAAVERGFGFSYLIATGSEVLLTAADFLRYAIEDEKTKVVATVLEEIRDVRTFQAALDRAAKLRKPVLVLILGRSAAGQRATSAHSGALATRAEIQEAFLRRAGAIVVNTLDDLIETIVLASAWEGKAPRRLAPLFATISGGDCSLVLDLASELGIETPELAPATQERLQALLPESTMLFNPIDLGTRPLLEETLGPSLIETAAADPAIDVVMTRLFGTSDDLRRVAEACARSGKPYMFFTRSAAALDPAYIEVARETRAPVLKSIDRALSAVERMVNHAATGLQPESVPATPPVWLDQLPSRRLSEAEALEFLRANGLATVEFRQAASIEDAVNAADDIGYPVAIKVDSPDIEHKSDVGAVRLGVMGADQVACAVRSVIANAKQGDPAAEIRGVIVQQMLRPELELIIGFLPDARFGPAVLVGIGGLLAEMLGRAEVRLAPISEQEAEETIARLLVPRGATRRNWRGLDISSAARFLSRFSDIAVAAGDCFEAIEVNPLAVFGNNGGAVALDCLMLPRGSVDAPYSK